MGGNGKKDVNGSDEKVNGRGDNITSINSGKKTRIKVERITELYERGRKGVEQEISKEEKFLKILSEIAREREKLRGKPRMRWLRVLITAFLVGIGIFIMFLPERDIVGRSIFDFNPPSDFYIEAGKYTVVNFFASWCDPCLDEIPELVDFAKNGDKMNAAVVGVVVNDTPENIKKLARETGLNYSVVFDNTNFFERLGFKAIPVTLIVGPDTIIKKVIFGPVTREKLEAYIQLFEKQDKKRGEKDEKNERKQNVSEKN